MKWIWEHIVYIFIYMMIGLFVMGLVADKLYGYLAKKAKRQLLDNWDKKYGVKQ